VHREHDEDDVELEFRRSDPRERDHRDADHGQVETGLYQA